MKKLLSTFLILFLVVSATVSIVSTSDSLVPILMYHSIDDANSFNTPTVSPANFSRQMRFLKENGFNVIAPDEFIESVKKGKDIPYKSVVVTFDDGYKDNLINAYPVLKKNGIPATIFVPADYLDRNGYISTEDALMILKDNISIGAHTKTHCYLPGVTADRLLLEVKGAKDELDGKLGVSVKLFCYPIGGFTEEAKRAVSSAGYIGACTTNRSRSIMNKDMFALNRIKMTNKDANDLILWAKTSRIYNLLRGIRNHFKKP